MTKKCFSPLLFFGACLLCAVRVYLKVVVRHENSRGNKNTENLLLMVGRMSPAPGRSRSVPVADCTLVRWMSSVGGSGWVRLSVQALFSGGSPFCHRDCRQHEFLLANLLFSGKYNHENIATFVRQGPAWFHLG